MFPAYLQDSKGTRRRQGSCIGCSDLSNIPRSYDSFCTNQEAGAQAAHFIRFIRYKSEYRFFCSLFSNEFVPFVLIDIVAV